MRPRRVVSAATVILVAIATMAQLPVAWKNWRYSASIDAGTVEGARYISVVVPATVVAHATQGLKDLRVIDGQGREVPYALSARLGGRATDRRDARLLEPSVVAGQYSQAIFDLGASPRVHNVVTLGLAGTDDVLTWVEVAVSDDHEHWRVVRNRAPIYRLQQAGLDDHTTVTYPESVTRYLRVRILDGSRPYTIERGTVVHEVVTEAERVPAGATLTAGSGPTESSLWTATTAAVPMSEVRFETSQASFYRPVSVEVSVDGSTWVHAGSGEIYRTVEAGQKREQLSVSFQEQAAIHWRVTVHNRNDAPLGDLHAAFYMTPRHLIVRQEPSQEYRLLYGNARVQAPQYDMARLVDPEVVAAAIPVTVGAELANAGYADPAPWTERHPEVMWLALGLAVVVLGGLAVRTMRR